MPNHNTSSKVNNSSQTASDIKYKKLTTPYLLRTGYSDEPIAYTVDVIGKDCKALKAGFPKDFATKICKVKNYAYLCSAKEPDFGHNKVIRTLFERVPVALLHPQSWFFGENKRDTLSFCIY